jgi:Ca2+-binding RTX toxin-like protein
VGLTIQNGRETFAGGIKNLGTLTIRNTTISDNESTNGTGGGILSDGVGSELTLENVTISGNSTISSAGGLAVLDGDVAVRSSTITDNTADSNNDDVGSAGGFFTNGGVTTFTNTILAGNKDLSATPEPDCHSEDVAQTVSAGATLIQNLTGCTRTAGPGDITGQSAKLGQLADNGGSSFTHALLAGSPAIDKATATAPALDQRGFPRIGLPDIGAYERAVCNGLPANRVGTAGADTLTGTPAADVILGQGGNDLLKGLGGKDVICGVAGNDRLLGGVGNDKLIGGAGKDRLVGGKGRDRLLGQAGRDRLIGGKGRDVLRGGPGRDLQRQ